MGRVGVYALVVAGTLAAFLAILALWINRQVMDTDNWTSASSQMLEDRAIRTAVADYVVDQLYTNVDVAGELQAVLPPRAQPLAAPAAAALRNVAEDATNRLLLRPRTQVAWENANRTAHETFLQIVEGGGPLVSTEGGAVKLHLGAIVKQLANRTGVGGKVAAKIPPDAAQLTVLKSDQLSFAQKVAKALRPLAIILLLLILVFYGGAIWLAGVRRREALRAAGFGFVVAGALALAVKSVAGDAVVNALATTAAAHAAVESVWRIYTPLLEEAATASIGYGVAIVIGAWLAGPTRPAVAIRRVLAPYVQRPEYAYGAGAVIVLLIIDWGPTPATRKLVPALILIALFALGVEAFRRQTAREFPDATSQGLIDGLESLFSFGRTQFGRARESWQQNVSERPHPSSPQPPATEPPEDPLTRLERLAALHDRGVLDDEEFAGQKRAILAGESAAPASGSG